MPTKRRQRKTKLRRHVVHHGPSLAGCSNSRVILDRKEQMLGLIPTPSGLRLEDVKKESRRRVIAQVIAPREKFTLPLNRMKSRCSLGWLVIEKQ